MQNLKTVEQILSGFVNCNQMLEKKRKKRNFICLSYGLESDDSDNDDADEDDSISSLRYSIFKYNFMIKSLDLIISHYACCLFGQWGWEWWGDRGWLPIWSRRRWRRRRRRWWVSLQQSHFPSSRFLQDLLFQLLISN